MKKRIFKEIIIAFGIVIVIFNMIWLYNYSLFKEFNNGLEEYKKFQTYSTYEDGYSYNLKFPSYLSFVGNLAVSVHDGDNSYTLIIWPSRFKDTKYGVMVPEGHGGNVSIMISEDLEAEDEYDQIYIDENIEQIEVLFQKAHEKFGTKFE